MLIEGLGTFVALWQIFELRKGTSDIPQRDEQLADLTSVQLQAVHRDNQFLSVIKHKFSETGIRVRLEGRLASREPNNRGLAVLELHLLREAINIKLGQGLPDERVLVVELIPFFFVLGAVQAVHVGPLERLDRLDYRVDVLLFLVLGLFLTRKPQ